MIIDVRSPAEYAHARIPGAKLLPLFSDEERKTVGTLYKQVSRQKAIKAGLQFFGPKMVVMVEQVEQWLAEHQLQNPGAGGKAPKNPRIVVHCWRGGMRSAGVAWLLDLYGFSVFTLQGGYKAFRHWCLDQLEKDYPFRIIGGFTGSGKTAFLQHLSALGETIVDLESLAAHKGSAFGNIRMPAQPSQEMFENLLALALHTALAQVCEGGAIWMEDESQRIGDVNIPTAFFRKMRQAPLVFADIPFEERLSYIVQDYGKGDTEKLVNAIIRISKRLGGLETKHAIQCLLDNDLRGSFAILLRYYDKWYQKGLDAHQTTLSEPMHRIALAKSGDAEAARAILSLFSGKTT